MLRSPRAGAEVGSCGARVPSCVGSGTPERTFGSPRCGVEVPEGTAAVFGWNGRLRSRRGRPALEGTSGCARREGCSGATGTLCDFRGKGVPYEGTGGSARGEPLVRSRERKTSREGNPRSVSTFCRVSCENDRPRSSARRRCATAGPACCNSATQNRGSRRRRTVAAPARCSSAARSHGSRRQRTAAAPARCTSAARNRGASCAVRRAAFAVRGGDRLNRTGRRPPRGRRRRRARRRSAG